MWRFVFFKQKTAYEMRISDWSSDGCSSDRRMTDGGEQGGRAIPVLNIGAMNGEADEQAGGVGDNVAFASLDLLSGIIARNTAAFRGFDALAVDDAGRRTGLAAHRFPGRHDKMMVDRSQKTVVADRKSTRLNSSH